MRRTRFAAVGSYVPPNAVTNLDLEGPLSITARSIERRTGIRQRFWNTDPKLATSDLALEATNAALASSAPAFEGATP